MEQISFHYLLMTTHLTLQKNLLALLHDTGLTSGQPKILDYLHEHDGANQKEIAAACHMEAASLTAVLNGMENKNLIERRMLNGNRRSSHIFLTEKGKEMQKKVLDAFSHLETLAFKNIPNEDLTCFLEVFCKIYDNMKTAKETVRYE